MGPDPMRDAGHMTLPLFAGPNPLPMPFKNSPPHPLSLSSHKLSHTRTAPPSSCSSPPPPLILIMQQCIEEVADDLDALSFDSSTTTTTTTTTGGVGMKLSTSSESEAATWTASSLASSSTKPHTPSGDPRWQALRRVQSRKAAALSLGDLKFIRRLGSGDIGSVYLAELKGGEGCVFAAKVMDKKELSKRNKEGRARIEREILELLDHPFLPTLYATLDSPRWSCLLTDFCPGGDLHVLRQRQPHKRFDEAAVRFYAAEVVAALEYLHMMGIIYRDLKPENVLVRSDGHIMLTDFDLSLKCDDPTSTAHVLSDHDYPPMPSPYPTDEPPAFATSACIIPSCIVPAVSCFHQARKRRRRWRRQRGLGGTPEIVAEPMDARSMSFVGTYEYLAPEIVSSEGHGNAVDWWTLGVFMYELFYGVTPFKGIDNELTLANIVARALEFPRDPPVVGPAKDLIAQLLIKEPTKRMGSTRGATAIKRHPFFQGVNWALLRCRKPPCVPRPMSLRDLVSADDYDGDTSVEYY